MKYDNAEIIKQSAQYYRPEDYPQFVGHHGNWDIYCNYNGAYAAIAVNPQCANSHFGDIFYALQVLAKEMT